MNWRLFLATFLHAFIFVLILWWMIFAVSLIDRYEPSSTMVQHRNMLMWEGGTLLFLVLVTGGITVYLLLREKRQMQKLEEFVAGFTHDLKTALARVRLQTESLRADNRDSSLNELFNRLITDTSRLETQVQNSLFIGAHSRPRPSTGSSLHPEARSLLSLVDLLQDSWPQIEIVADMNGSSDAVLNVDGRAMESVLSNLIHNSIIHGQATRVTIQAKSMITSSKGGAVANGVRLRVFDNGHGFHGDVKRLGEMFFRHNPSSGSGLGLFTVKSYVERMQGSVKFETLHDGFCIEIVLPGIMKT